MKRGSTLFLRLALIIMGLIVLALCVFAVPSMTKSVGAEFPSLTYVQYPLMVIMYGSAIAFFVALYQAWKLLLYIDTNTAFSESSIVALRNIKYCAVAIGALFIVNIPLLFFPIAELDDAPGVIIVGGIIAAAPFVVAVFSAVLERLLHDVIRMKYENDLTV